MAAEREDFHVREVPGLCPRLREGLHFSIRIEDAGPVCMIEDTANSRFHRVGEIEYRFLSQLDGTRTVATLLAELARQSGSDGLSEREALQVLDWARNQQLLMLDSQRGVPERIREQEVVGKAVNWLNPLMIRIPLGRPDRMFLRSARSLRWLFSIGGVVLWCLVVLLGVVAVSSDWARFSRGFEGILSRDNWAWLLVVFAGLKIAHEFAHGVCCRHYGVPVREWGVLLVLGMPLGYVDATASVRLASRWKRIAVSSAGMGMEIFLAGVAALVWAQAPEGRVSDVAHNVIFAGTVVSLFFNANPLMRFDGYFILADWLDIPNLAGRARQWVQTALLWLCLGGQDQRPQPLRTREDWLLAVYGVLAWLWQALVMVGLIAGASAMFRGGGLFFAVVAAVGWVGLPLWQFASRLANGAVGHWGRVSVRVGGLVLLLVAVATFRFQSSITAPAVVEWADTQIVRAECPGVVETVLVRDGEAVQLGQVLMRLRNPEAESALARSRLALEQEELRARLAYTRESVAAYQAIQASVAARRETVAQNEKYVGTLQIVAPFAGRISGRRLDTLAGSFIQRGEEILRIGTTESRDLKVAISQEQEPGVRGAVDAPVRARIHGRGAEFEGRLIRLEARAGREIVLPALTALAGGPLPVRRSEGRTPDDIGYELTDPYFLGTVRVAATGDLLPGETGRVKLEGTRTTSPWEILQRQFTRLWNKAITRRGGDDA